MTQHHPTHPHPAAHTPAWLPPATAPSFKDLLRRTRSPLRMAHQKPTALFSKKASALPLNLFSWSAAAALGMLATFSFGTPAQAEFCRIDFDFSGYSLVWRGGIFHPSCTVLSNIIGDNVVISRVHTLIINTGRDITSLDFSGFSGFSGFSNLTRLVYWDSRALNIDLSGLSSLTKVRILGSRTLTNIDLSGLSSLSELYIGGNAALTSIDLSGLSSLAKLSIEGNNALTSIDLSDLSSLAHLGIDNNEALTSIVFPSVCNDLREGSYYRDNDSIIYGKTDTGISDNGNFPDLSFLDIKERCGTKPDQEPEPTPEPEPDQEPEPTPDQEPDQEPEPTPDQEPDQEPEPTPDQTDDTLEELDNTIKDILEGEGSNEEKRQRVEEELSKWKDEELQQAKSILRKELLIGAAKVFIEELNPVGGVKKKIAEKALKKAAKYAPKVVEAVKKGEAVKKTIDKINIKKRIDNLKETIDDVKNIKEGVDLIIEETNSSSNNIINKSIYNLAEALYLNHNALQNGTVSLDQAFSGQRFSVPFSLAQTDSQDQGSSPRFNALLEADINFSRFSNSSDPDLSIDGTTTNYGIGVTVIPNPEVPLVTGLQLGYTRSDSDFEHTDTDGTYNLRMFSVHPFIAWDATDSLTVWSTVGYGRPNDETIINSVYGIEIPAAESTESTEDSTFTSSGDFFSFAGGANYRVWQSDLSALSIGLSGSTTSFLGNDSKDGSISAQFSHDFPFNTGQLQTSADLALILSDSGPSATELSGNLNWLPNQGRLSGSTNARVLLFGGDRSEWGIGGSVTLLPGERGEGLSLALRPSFGQTNTSLSNLHLDPFSFSDPTELALSTTPLTARFNAELAYGFRTGNHALLTPYTKLNMGHYGTTTSAGLRYQLDNSLDLDLSASHRTRSSGNNDNRFFLQLRSDL